MNIYQYLIYVKAVENYTQNSTWAIPINNGCGNYNKTNNNSIIATAF
jgi:hypothetical protein